MRPGRLAPQLRARKSGTWPSECDLGRVASERTGHLRSARKPSLPFGVFVIEYDAAVERTRALTPDEVSLLNAVGTLGSLRRPRDASDSTPFLREVDAPNEGWK